MKYARDNLAAGVLLALAALLLMACGADAAQTPTPSATKVTTIAVATAAPTDTPVPATSTPTPKPVTSTSTPQPTRTPAPTSTSTALKPQTSSSMTKPQAASKINVDQTIITLPTYPIWDYLIEQIDPVYNIPVYYFNRVDFEAADPAPIPVDYTGEVLENPYLRLTFLPELGGRLYSAVIKSTGQEIFYHNPVIKPSRYGVLEPYEANWWLAAGGMDWAYPTQEHGYRFGVPWDYEVSQSNTAATITLSDTGPDRVGVEVRVTLTADSAVFTVAPKLVNAGPETVPVQFWLNAALALSPDSMFPGTQFIIPINEIVVHSRGEAGWAVPGAHTIAPWPVIGQTDLRQYRQWANYLGFFVPHMKASFMGAYNPNADLGVVRLIEPGTVPGNKLFAFGPDFSDRSYTSDDSQYFEIWGGANTSFWPEDDVEVPGGGTLEWQESWWPLTGLGGLTWANRHAAINLEQAGDVYHLALLVPCPWQGRLEVLGGEEVLLTDEISPNPNTPLRWVVPVTAAPIRVKLLEHNQTVLLDYCPDC